MYNIVNNVLKIESFYKAYYIFAQLKDGTFICLKSKGIVVFEVVDSPIVSEKPIIVFGVFLENLKMVVKEIPCR